MILMRPPPIRLKEKRITEFSERKAITRQEMMTQGRTLNKSSARNMDGVVPGMSHTWSFQWGRSGIFIGELFQGDKQVEQPNRLRYRRPQKAGSFLTRHRMELCTLAF
jgi:hypothetical protein